MQPRLVLALAVVVLAAAQLCAGSSPRGWVTGLEAERTPLTQEKLGWKYTDVFNRHLVKRGEDKQFSEPGEPTERPELPRKVEVRLCAVEVSEAAAERVVTGTFEKDIALSMGVAGCWPAKWTRTVEFRAASYRDTGIRYQYAADHYCEPLRMFASDDGDLPPPVFGDGGKPTRVTASTKVKDCKANAHRWRGTTTALPRHELARSEVACSAEFPEAERPLAATHVRASAGGGLHDLVKLELRDVHLTGTELVGEARVPTADTGGKCVWAELRHYTPGRIPFSRLIADAGETPYEVAGRVSVSVTSAGAGEGAPKAPAASSLSEEAAAHLRVALFDLMAMRHYSINPENGELSAETAARLGDVAGLDANSCLALLLHTVDTDGPASVVLNPSVAAVMKELRAVRQAHAGGGHLSWLERRALEWWDLRFPERADVSSYVHPDGWLMTPSEVRSAVKTLDAVATEGARIRAEVQRFDSHNERREADGKRPFLHRHKVKLSSFANQALMARARAGLHADNPVHAAVREAMAKWDDVWRPEYVEATGLFDAKPAAAHRSGLPWFGRRNVDRIHNRWSGGRTAALEFVRQTWRRAVVGRRDVGLLFSMLPDSSRFAINAADGLYDKMPVLGGRLASKAPAHVGKEDEARYSAVEQRLETLFVKANTWFGARLPSTHLPAADALRGAARAWGSAMGRLPPLIVDEFSAMLKGETVDTDPDWAAVEAALGSTAPEAGAATRTSGMLARLERPVDRAAALAVRLLHAASVPPPLYGVLPTTTMPRTALTSASAKA